ncbi:MAG TPA: zonular occludens toxin domain-containing protein, partial [Xylella sp.]
GKSYDAVRNHLLPALRDGRRVFARLNGLRHEVIADYLEMTEARVRELLVCVDTQDVVSTFVCYRDGTDGRWCIEDRFRDALIIIDEVHEFYVESRLSLPPPVENFWALLGQNGGDAVLMTQWIRRMHPAIRARIERKHSFQKLTVLGLKNHYRVTYYHTVSAGKFEKVGGQTLKYDTSIFPLYDGYAPGARNTEVYSQGKKTVWFVMALRAVFFLVIAAVGAHFFLGYFSKGDRTVPPSSGVSSSVRGASSPVIGQVYRPGQVVAAGRPSSTSQDVSKPVSDVSDLDPEQRYVVDLNGKGRLRLVVLAQVGSEYRAWVQWISAENNVIEQLDMEQLRALGFVVSVYPYGLRIAAGKHFMVATAWPWQSPMRETDQRLYNLSRDVRPVGGIASVASEAAEGPSMSGTVIEKRERAMGTFPESPGGGHGTDERVRSSAVH